MTDYLIPCGSTERAKELHRKVTDRLTDKDVSYFSLGRTCTIRIWGLFRNPFDAVRIRFSPYSLSEEIGHPRATVISAEVVEARLNEKEDIRNVPT